MQRIFILACICLIHLSLSAQDTNSIFESGKYNHVLKITPLSLLDFTSHSIDVSWEEQLRGKNFIEFSLGYTPNLNGNSFLERDFYGIRTQFHYRRYYTTYKSNRGAAFFGLALRNTYLWDNRNRNFLREQGYFQFFDHTEVKFKTGLFVTYGSVTTFGKNWTFDVGLMLGATHFYLDYRGVPDDAELLLNGFVNGVPQGHTFLPTFKLILKFGRFFNKNA